MKLLDGAKAEALEQAENAVNICCLADSASKPMDK